MTLFLRWREWWSENNAGFRLGDATTAKNIAISIFMNHMKLLLTPIILLASLLGIPIDRDSTPTLQYSSSNSLAVQDLQYAENGEFLVSCTTMGIQLWEAEAGKLIRSISGDQLSSPSSTKDCQLGFEQVAIARDGSFIVSARSCAATESGNHNKPYDENAGATFIEVWESKTGKLKKQIQISPYRVFVQEITLSPDAKQVAITTATAVHAYGYVEGELAFSVWDLASGKLLLERPYESGQFSAQNDYVLATGSKAIHLIHTLTRKEKASFFLDAEVLGMGMHPKGDSLYAATDGKLWVWAVNKAATPKIYDVPELAEYGAVPFFSQDGQHLILLNWNKQQLTKYSLVDGEQLSSQAIAMDVGAGAVPRLAINHTHRLMAYAHYPDVGGKALPIKAIRLFSEEVGFSYE